jgi:Glycosyltransferase family 87/WD40-like Beta Propeller Repeat
MKALATTSKSARPGSLDASSHFNAGPISLQRKWLIACQWMLLAVLLVQIGLRSAPKAWHTLGSDFPNYYLTARLKGEHYDTTRIYEWIWLQRQKDHRGVDQRTVGMVPITPFSTAFVYPFISMPPLAAKHCWLILNVGLLLATGALLHSLASLTWRHILLIAALSVPLRVNFLLGQYYVLLLFLLTLACWLYLRQKRFAAGLLVGLAAGLKIFPIVYLILFLRKRDWRAFAGGVVASVGSFAVSVWLFGWELNWIYLAQVLPATFRGEALAPYNLQAASLSSLLHRLFIYEPQLNPHPAVNIPWMFSVLHPLLQMVVVAPAIVLAVPGEHGPRRVRLEWAAVLLATLAISTSPASYLFTLLILPVALILGSLREEGKHLWAAVLLLLYVAAGFVGGKTDSGEGWAALAAVPRLYVLILLVMFSYMVLLRLYRHNESKRDRALWIFAVVAILVFGVVTNLRHQRALYADYKWRIAEPAEVLMASHPAVQADATPFIALLSDGYHSAVTRGDSVELSDASNEDQLAITATNGERWVEQTGKESTVRSTLAGRSDIRHAESPIASSDGRWLAFLREDHGRARISVRALDQRDSSDKLVTPPELNVLEMSFLPDGTLVFAANFAGRPSLFITNQEGSIQSLDIGIARYPSVSPDGHWLAYSQLQRGSWNLWLRNLTNGQTKRLTNAECNDTEPVWTEDSRTLVYASDCGRGLWLSALCRRRVVR